LLLLALRLSRLLGRTARFCLPGRATSLLAIDTRLIVYVEFTGHILRGTLKLADALPESSGDFRNPLRTEDEKNNEKNEKYL
jgi:hypothetical protein